MARTSVTADCPYEGQGHVILQGRSWLKRGTALALWMFAQWSPCCMAWGRGACYRLGSSAEGAGYLPEHVIF